VCCYGADCPCSEHSHHSLGLGVCSEACSILLSNTLAQALCQGSSWLSARPHRVHGRGCRRLQSDSVSCPAVLSACRNGAQKLLGVLITIGEAVAYVVSGMYGDVRELGAGNAILIIVQVTWRSKLLIRLL
jgi:hypothetical protein